MQGNFNNAILEAMSEGKPFKTYKKTILGVLNVIRLDPIGSKPDGVLVKGDPIKNEEDCLIDVWSQVEDTFFRKMNRRHLESGRLISFERKVEEGPKEKMVEEYSDEELEELVLKKKFFTLQNVLSKTESEALVYRLRTLAEKLEMSEKITKVIDSRLSELQIKNNTQNSTEE